jgi:hypothetical protein
MVEDPNAIGSTGALNGAIRLRASGHVCDSHPHSECPAGGHLGSRIAPCLIAIERDGDLAEMRGVVRGANDARCPMRRGAGVSPAMPVLLPAFPQERRHGRRRGNLEGRSTHRARRSIGRGQGTVRTMHYTSTYGIGGTLIGSTAEVEQHPTVFESRWQLAFRFGTVNRTAGIGDRLSALVLEPAQRSSSGRPFRFSGG